MNAPGETYERRPVSSEAASRNRLTTCNQDTPAGIDLHASRPVLSADEIAQIGVVQGRASQATFGPVVRTMLTGDQGEWIR